MKNKNILACFAYLLLMTDMRAEVQSNIYNIIKQQVKKFDQISSPIWEARSDKEYFKKIKTIVPIFSNFTKNKKLIYVILDSVVKDEQGTKEHSHYYAEIDLENINQSRLLAKNSADRIYVTKGASSSEFDILYFSKFNNKISFVSYSLDKEKRYSFSDDYVKTTTQHIYELDLTKPIGRNHNFVESFHNRRWDTSPPDHLGTRYAIGNNPLQIEELQCEIGKRVTIDNLGYLFMKNSELWAYDNKIERKIMDLDGNIYSYPDFALSNFHGASLDQLKYAARSLPSIYSKFLLQILTNLETKEELDTNDDLILRYISQLFISQIESEVAQKEILPVIKYKNEAIFQEAQIKSVSDLPFTHLTLKILYSAVRSLKIVDRKSDKEINSVLLNYLAKDKLSPADILEIKNKLTKYEKIWSNLLLDSEYRPLAIIIKSLL